MSSRRSAPWTAALVFTLGVLLSGATLLMKSTTGSASSLLEPVYIAFIAVGAVTIWRRPDNRVSWLFAWVGIALPFVEFADQYATLHYEHGRELPAASAAAWFSSWIWTLAFGPLATLLFLWFPTGRIPSPRWRWIERAAIGLMITAPSLFAFAEDPQSSSPYSNPLASEQMTRVAESFSLVIEFLFPIVVLACVASLVARYRGGDPDQRQQLKWFIVGAASLGLWMLVDTIASSVGGSPRSTLPWTIAGLGAFLSLPVAAAIAIFKYRLYDIDIIINRTLVYGGVTATLAGIYFLSIVVLQDVLPLSEDSDVAVAASTLAVAALFRPLRAHLQSLVDRRFYRSKYDAGKTLERFAGSLRERIDLEGVQSELLATVTTVMQPRSAFVWVTTGSPNGEHSAIAPAGSEGRA